MGDQQIPTASEQLGYLLARMSQQELRTELNRRRMENGLRIKREAVVLYDLYREWKEKENG